MGDEKDPQKLCGAKSSRNPGRTCQNVAGAGTDHKGYGRCKHHGGATPSGRISAEKQMVQERMLIYGGPIEVAPDVALLQEVHRTAGHVAYLGQVVSDLEKAQLVGPVGSDGMNDQGVTYYPAYKPSVWIEMYQGERSHLARVCKMALDAGIAERQVRLAERQGEMLAEAVQGILKDLGVLHHPDTPEVVRRHLYAIDGGAAQAS